MQISTKRDQKGQEKGAGMTIQSAKLDSFSCSNSFCLASRAGPDNSKRQKRSWQAFGARKPTYSG